MGQRQKEIYLLSKALQGKDREYLLLSETGSSGPSITKATPTTTSTPIDSGKYLEIAGGNEIAFSLSCAETRDYKKRGKHLLKSEKIYEPSCFLSLA